VKVHYLQHVPFEGLGSIEGWLKSRRAEVSVSRLYEDARLPKPDAFDWLIAMGGPMSVNDERVHPWLAPEKRLVADAIARDKVVLGICLGAQLIASALGSRLYRNKEREIGWFPIERIASVERGVAAVLPERCEVFHWHGETFDLPPGAVQIARSAGCENQAFQIGERVVGLQFHLETTPASAKALVEHCGSEIVPGRFIQTDREILGSPDRFERINKLMSGLLDRLAEPTV
jgi:GMP synthase-like glutamine amidotransferase